MEMTWVLVANAARAWVLAAHSSQSGPRVVTVVEHQHELARYVALMLDSAADSGKFDQLVLIGSYEFLGELRENLHVPVSARIAREITKDIADSSEKEVLTTVRHILTKCLALRTRSLD
jgi:protein required for attachment to host cells